MVNRRIVPEKPRELLPATRRPPVPEFRSDLCLGQAMAGNRESGSGRSGSLRMAVWAAATALMVLVPLLAMRVTDEVSWTGFDFAYAGA